MSNSFSTVNDGISFLYSLFTKHKSHTKLYALSRSLIALSLLLTLLVNSSEILYPTERLLHWQPRIIWQKISLFYVLKQYHALHLFKPIAISVLSLVILGYLPQITGVLHWYITYSYFNFSPVCDGGENIALIFTFLLIPITLTDNRLNHWFSSKNQSKHLQFIANTAYLMCKLQISVVYLTAICYKITHPDWLNGKVLYYFILEENLQPADAFLRFLLNIFSHPVAGKVICYSVILLQSVLVFSWLFSKKWRNILFVLAVLFHLTTVFLFGITTFFLVIVGALLLFFYAPAPKPSFINKKAQPLG